MKTRLLPVLFLALGLTAASAGERPTGDKSKPGKFSGMSFEEFAAAIDDDFNDFRTAVIENYAKWLDGEWEAFQPKMILKPEPRPKPEKAPVKSPAEPAPAVAPPPRPLKPTPRPDISVTAVPEGKLRPKTGIDPLVDRPSLATTPTLAPGGGIRPKKEKDPLPPVEETPVEQPSALVEQPSVPVEQPAAPVAKPVVPEAPKGPQDRVKFYGMEIDVPKLDFAITPSLKTTGDMARHWKTLDADKTVRKAAAMLQKKGEEMGLNGYLTYELMRAYAESKFPDANAAAITSLTHYLMANAGYDVRLAQTGAGVPLMLMPFDSAVYGISFITLDGKDYTVFVPSGFSQDDVNGAIYTARLPQGESLGRVTSLELQGLNLPEKPRSFDISAGPLHLKGTLNENLFPLVYRYPQMPTEGYASSVLMPGLRKELVAQVKDQLGSMKDRDAVNGMLEFFHRGLSYATDQEYHGFEKPYFLEETLYYPKCDCEDRAIMMTYLLWEGLGLENQLLAYPGHESAAVRLSEPINGIGYTSGGKTYYSCDPTYIGSSVGDCMPAFRNESPTIDKTLPGAH
ncbi:MAG: hypothetical protein K2O24_04095 [Muribaculaceae bacterium]|nr:hypothetical protein [Muribaculaceae bacterium]